MVFVLLWSGGFAFAKLGLRYAEPFTFLALRYLVLVVCLAVLFVALRPPLPATRAEVGHQAVVGLLIQSLYFVLAYAAFVLGVSAGTFYEKRFGTARHPVTANLVQYVVALVTTAPLALLFETLTIEWTTEFVVSLAYLVVANSLISLTLLLAMIRAGEVSRVSVLFFLVPPTAAAAAWLLVDESMPWQASLGMVIALAGVVIVTRKGSLTRIWW